MRRALVSYGVLMYICPCVATSQDFTISWLLPNQVAHFVDGHFPFPSYNAQRPAPNTRQLLQDRGWSTIESVCPVSSGQLVQSTRVAAVKDQSLDLAQISP